MHIIESYLQLTDSPLTLIRRGGLFFKRRVSLAEVSEILSVNRDAVTHDEVQICFRSVDGREFLISESDGNFKNVIEALKSKFPGIENWSKVGEGAPLKHRVMTLWTKCAET